MTHCLDRLEQRAKEEWESLQSGSPPRILVGSGSCGRSAGSREIADAFRDETGKRGVDCRIIEVGCIGLCYAEPMICVGKPSRPSVFYGNVTRDKAAEIIDSYLIRDDPLPSCALGTLGEDTLPGIPRLSEIPFFNCQKRRVLGNCGLIDPTSINHYLAQGGYRGLARALAMSPGDVIDEVRESGLRGKGGAGFPTWRKWQFSRDARASKKYVVCNGSEGDPGVFSNRVLLESDPHKVLEGMLIAGYAIGAEEGYVYCPADYPLALERLRIALTQMEENQLLGDGILGSSFRFRIQVKVGAGAYICGEESALIECIEGKRGIPRPRPPFPPVSGLWAKPTIVNNVETLAGVTLVLRQGASAFAELGTEGSRGTKVLCLSGAVRHIGTIEVPFGTSLRQIVFDIGGGTFDSRPVKAVQIGGPGGGWLPAALLDVPVDHDSLSGLGASLGSGGVVVIGEDACMVDVARDSLDFAQRECCGQCVPCRLGTKQMFDVVKDITRGRGSLEDLDLLTELAKGVRLGSLCGLGQTAPNPLLSTIRHFRDEYVAHIRDKNCPAGVCTLPDIEPAEPVPAGYAGSVRSAAR